MPFDPNAPIFSDLRQSENDWELQRTSDQGSQIESDLSDSQIFNEEIDDIVRRNSMINAGQLNQYIYVDSDSDEGPEGSNNQKANQKQSQKNSNNNVKNTSSTNTSNQKKQMQTPTKSNDFNFGNQTNRVQIKAFSDESKDQNNSNRQNQNSDDKTSKNSFRNVKKSSKSKGQQQGPNSFNSSESNQQDQFESEDYLDSNDSNLNQIHSDRSDLESDSDADEKDVLILKGSDSSDINKNSSSIKNAAAAAQKNKRLANSLKILMGIIITLIVLIIGFLGCVFCGIINFSKGETVTVQGQGRPGTNTNIKSSSTSEQFKLNQQSSTIVQDHTDQGESDGLSGVDGEKFADLSVDESTASLSSPIKSKGSSTVASKSVTSMNIKPNSRGGTVTSMPSIPKATPIRIKPMGVPGPKAKNGGTTSAVKNKVGGGTTKNTSVSTI